MGIVTAAPDLAPALAALPPGQLERALRRRLLRATVDGSLDSPLLTQYPAETARLVLDLVANVLMLKGFPPASDPARPGPYNGTEAQPLSFCRMPKSR